jgi:multidrug efflux pump
VLTAAAAVLAMIPLSQSEFWGPMAVAIMGGLILATGLTLLALPAMYATAFNVYPPRKKRHRLPHEKRRSRPKAPEAATVP